jgi:hypothetical protein
MTEVKISDGGDSITVSLPHEGDREGTWITIDGVKYHIERIRKERLMAEFSIDDDPDYDPQSDAEGYCCVIAPFSK